VGRDAARTAGRAAGSSVGAATGAAVSNSASNPENAVVGFSRTLPVVAGPGVAGLAKGSGANAIAACGILSPFRSTFGVAAVVPREMKQSTAALCG
jgi:hypothetical protein